MLSGAGTDNSLGLSGGVTHDDEEHSGGVTYDGQVPSGGVTYDGQVPSGGVTHDGQIQSGGVMQNCRVLCGGVTHDGLTAPCGMYEGEPGIGAGAVLGDGVLGDGVQLKKESGLSSPTRGRVKRIRRGQPTQLGISIDNKKVKLAISGGMVESQEFNQHRRGSQGFQFLSLNGVTETKDEIGKQSSDDKQRSALQQQTSMGTGNLWGDRQALL